jgi:hypothetical protein
VSQEIARTQRLGTQVPRAEWLRTLKLPFRQCDGDSHQSWQRVGTGSANSLAVLTVPQDRLQGEIFLTESEFSLTL